MGRDKRVDAALIELQRAATVDGVWKASVKLMRAAMPTYNVLLGLVSLGIMPMFMRATKPIPNVERFAQLAPLNDVIRERPLTPVARMSDDYSPDTPNGRALLEEFLKPMGWRHGAALLFWNADGGFRGQLTVIRTEQQGDYSDAEMDFLRELHPHVEAVIDRLFALEQAFAAHLSLEHAIDALPLPIVIAGWELLFVINLLWSWFKGPKAAVNPWEATTLEWTVPSPPPHDNFAGLEPTVYRGPYEFSVPGAANDYQMQNDPEGPKGEGH